MDFCHCEHSEAVPVITRHPVRVTGSPERDPVMRRGDGILWIATSAIPPRNDGEIP